jgi:hypothetical protein
MDEKSYSHGNHISNLNCEQWYNRNVNLKNSEMKAMYEFRPDAKCEFLPNGRMYWSVNLQSVVSGKAHNWVLLMLYRDNYCEGSFYSIDVYPVSPSCDEILDRIQRANVTHKILKTPPRTIKDNDGLFRLCLTPDISDTKITSAYVLKCAMRWIAFFELALTDKMIWSTFEADGEFPKQATELIHFQKQPLTSSSSIIAIIVKKLMDLFSKEHQSNANLTSKFRQEEVKRESLATVGYKGVSNYVNTGKAHSKCLKIVMSDRAMAQIYSETLSKGNNESGGLLLGHFIDGIWYIIESSDPGYNNSVFRHSYHESDEQYVNHVCAILSRIYKYPLNFLGMWHRHPGSLDSFSGTDDMTNAKYAKSAGNGCISLLANIDPRFRFTAYYVELSENGVIYTKTDLNIGDKYILKNDVKAIATPSDIGQRIQR